ncbi:Sodium/hydrogen exchanger [Candidatus Zixiibacteriota bacterium]|nr:Sodium/hydrogen exchanger [candidate division Zixibacteria bacterium]
MKTTEWHYIILLFGLFVVPRFLQRFRLPTAITSLALGLLAGLGLGLFTGDETIRLLSTFGIVSLFLFAGLDLNFHEIRLEVWVIFQHIIFNIVGIVIVSVAAGRIFHLDMRAALLTALALVTPSTGFILDSIRQFGLDSREQFWVRSKAIATELVALIVLFITLQSVTMGKLGLSFLALIAMIAILPVLFRFFALRVAPFAPNSEFAFLLIVAVASAFLTMYLGVYYLVGAFVVGITAQRFRTVLPSLTSAKMLFAVEVFASFFVPFYFFAAGLNLERSHFSLPAFYTGLLLATIIIPLRLLVVALHRRVTLGESYRKSFRIGLSMLPTLVFSLVILAILRDRFDLPPYLFGGIVIYTIINTVLPGFILRISPPDYESPHVPETATGLPENNIDFLSENSNSQPADR